MRPATESQELFKGALILTCAAMVTKILSAVYRIPFQNIVGDIGFYIYQQVYPFYGMMLILATQGFPVIISKLYKEQLSRGDVQKGIRVLTISFFVISILGLSLFLFFFLGADMIASVMGDEQLSTLFRVIAFPFLILPFTSVVRGSFQGEGNMIPTALSQVGEQLVRVLTILVLSYVFVELGYSLYMTGSGAVFGSVTGGLVGLWIVGFFFLKSNIFNAFKEYGFRTTFSDVRMIIKIVVIQGFAISISSMVLILMQLADALSLYNLLLSAGMAEEEAKIAKGVFDRGQPLIQLGTVVATSMALTLVPAISGKQQIIKDVRVALQIGLVVGAAAAIGLFSIIEPTNVMLFEDKEGSFILALLSMTILPGSVMITIVGVLQGLNQTIFPAVMILFGFGLKYVLNLFLVPHYGTIGAALASILALSTVLILLITKLRRILKQRVLSLAFMMKVFLSAGTMGLFLHIYLAFTDFIYLYTIPGRMGASIQALTAVGLGAILYLFLVIKMKLLKEQELLVLPFGSKLLFLLPKKTGDD